MYLAADNSRMSTDLLKKLDAMYINRMLVLRSSEFYLLGPYP
jgi:hypothetical protein